VENFVALGNFIVQYVWKESQGHTPSGCSKRLFSKAGASGVARRYLPAFVGPFASRMDLGERIGPSSASYFRKILVEPLSDARMPLTGSFRILL